MTVPVLKRTTLWGCPNCGHSDVTHESAPHTRMHPCRGLAGLLAPMVPAGTVCKIVAREREDYVGDEVVQTDGNGRPVMSVEVHREDGMDAVVYAPCATATAKDLL